MTDATLIARLEAATGDQQRELLLEAWAALNGPSPGLWNEGFAEWAERKADFETMLDAEAYESAALTLVPEGWIVDRLQQSTHTESAWCARLVRTDGGNIHLAGVQAFAPTPALAICIASLKARGGGEGD